MKKIIQSTICITLVLFSLNTANAQEVKFPGLDVSPADIAILRTSRGAPPIAKVIYGRPQMKGRKVFGAGEEALVPYGSLWRTGANETTEIIFYKDVTFAGEDVEAGTYSLYTIPGQEEWTIILNSKLHTWGHFQYDETSDVLRVNVPAADHEPAIEAFSIKFEAPEEGSGEARMVLGWENTKVEVPVEF